MFEYIKIVIAWELKQLKKIFTTIINDIKDD